MSLTNLFRLLHYWLSVCGGYQRSCSSKRKGERTTKITKGRKKKWYQVIFIIGKEELRVKWGSVCVCGGDLNLCTGILYNIFLFFFLLLCFCLNNFSLVRHDIRERREGVLFFGSLFLPLDFFPARFECAWPIFSYRVCYKSIMQTCIAESPILLSGCFEKYQGRIISYDFKIKSYTKSSPYYDFVQMVFQFYVITLLGFQSVYD